LEPLTISLILGAALAASEALSLIPKLNGNGLFQFIWRLLKVITADKKE